MIFIKALKLFFKLFKKRMPALNVFAFSAGILF